MEDAESAFARGDDEFVLVFGNRGREGGSDVEDVLATSYGVGPACVTFEVGGNEGEAVG